MAVEIHVWKFRLGKKIGSGSFGDIYVGYHKDTGETAAIKLERADAQYPQLAWEYKIYSLLSKDDSFPRIYWFGVEGDFIGLAMEFLGHSIESLFNFCQRKFTLKTVLLIGEDMLQRVETLHSIGYIHRDIKPDNFLIGRGAKRRQIFCIDFGLAKKFMEHDKHIDYSEGLNLTGTARYASINNHRGCEQSRRDDLEAILYVLIYFLQGSLPWQGIQAGTKGERYELIKRKKISYPVEELCRHCPDEFKNLVIYVRGLSFMSTPNYAHMRALLRQVYVRKGFGKPELDWDEEENK